MTALNRISMQAGHYDVTHLFSSLVVLLFCLCNLSYAAAPSSPDLFFYHEQYPGAEESLAPHKIKEWKAVERSQLNLGFVEGNIWVKFQIEPNHSGAPEIML